ncbi:MAG: hypothetical protein A2Y81_11735 [Nitrospirae bacterium RBG_13_43_8]|nr:MAG: hypothetical protein A2Y81_11735 [Nitrospirae bacterium RBG_13_43_8]
MVGMRKGIGPFAIAAVAVVAVMVIYGVVIGFLVGEHESVVRSVREREIIKMINEMEWVKKIIPQVMEYSFYQSAYSLGSQGGYFNPNDAPSYDCIPYWRVYGSTFYPDSLESNLNKTFETYLNSYAAALQMDLPQYEISFQQDEDGFSVNIIGNGNLVVSRGIARVEDQPDFSEKFSLDFFDVFAKGRNFVEQDSIFSAITNSLGVPCEEQQGMIISELRNLETDEMKLEVQNVQVDCEGHAAATVLVRIFSPEQYRVYDYEENTTELRNIQLKFLVVTGNAELINPEINVCSSV